MKTPTIGVSKLNFALLVAIFSAGLSAFNFYFANLRLVQRLEVTTVDGNWSDIDSTLSLRLAFVNSGNREAAILDVQPSLWQYRPSSSGVWQRISDFNVSDHSAVVRPGDIVVIDVSGGVARSKVDLATFLVPHNNTFWIMAGVYVDAINSKGDRYISHFPAAYLQLATPGPNDPRKHIGPLVLGEFRQDSTTMNVLDWNDQGPRFKILDAPIVKRIPY